MSSTRTFGALLLADISGFDEYLAGVELEHAGGVLRELVELLLEELQPPFQAASVEGDAVLAHAPLESAPRSEALVQLLEGTFLTFRQRLGSIRRNSTCTCRACEAVPRLDLKFLIHAGEYLSETVDGRPAISGLATMLVRERHLKDQAPPGLRAYALFTDSAADAFEVSLPASSRQVRTYPQYGEVATRLLDLEARFPALEQAARRRLSPETATLAFHLDYAQSPGVLWNWLNDPHKRTRWMAARSWTAGLRPGGRLDVGAVNHCAHGFGSLVETIVDWQPVDTFTSTITQPSLRVDFVATFDLTPTPDGGTHVRLLLKSGPAGSPWLDNPLLRRGLKALYTGDYRRLARLLNSDSPA